MGIEERYATVGSMAAALRRASGDLREIEGDVEDFIEALYPGWRPKFPPRLGWRFTAPDVIDVFGVVESPAATDALFKAGFRRVVAHDHRSGEPCGCAARVDSSGPPAIDAPRGDEI